MEAINHESLKLELEDKNKQLELYKTKQKELGNLVLTLQDRVESLSNVVSSRHAILDEANKSVAVAIDRNKYLGEAMKGAIASIDDGDCAAARASLRAALDTPAGTTSETVAYLESMTGMRDDVMTAIRLLERSLPGVTP